MSLLDYQPEQREIQFKGGSLAVRAISLDTLAVLIRTHLMDLESIITLVTGVLEKTHENGEIGAKASESIAMSLATEAPGLVANIIALAAGEPGEKGVAAARSMSFPLQVEILKAVGSLTFEEVGGVKKFMETLMSLLGLLNMETLIAAMQNPR